MEVSQKTENRVRPQALMKNKMSMSFDAISVNEAFARIAVAAFIAPLNPTIEEISDIKTAVSEAVTNAIIHGYDEEFLREKPESIEKPVYLRCMLEEDVLLVEVQDQGKGIEILTRPWSRFLQQNRKWTDPAWALRSWRRLWMIWR